MRLQPACTMRAMRRPVMCARPLAVVLAALAVVSLGAQQRAPGLESIRQEDLRADLFFLAGDAMRGRLTDTVENVATGDYIRARFERAGLKPAAPGGSYFQNYHLMTATLGEGNGLEVTGAGGGTQRFAHGQEFYPQRFSASGTAAGPVVFAGFGTTAPRVCAASALRQGVDGSEVTTPSNGLFGSRSPGSWSRMSTILPLTSPA